MERTNAKIHCEHISNYGIDFLLTYTHSSSSTEPGALIVAEGPRLPRERDNAVAVLAKHLFEFFAARREARIEQDACEL